MIESDILYQKGDFWVYEQPRGTFNVYRAGLTHSTRVAIITEGAGGLKRAKQEADKRAAAVTQDTDTRVRRNPSKFAVGDRVQVSDHAGIDSYKIGTIVPPKVDGRGIPITTKGGDYKPFRPREEVFVKTDDGETFVMYKVLLRAIRAGSDVRRKNPGGVKALRAHPRGGDYAWRIERDHLDHAAVNIVGPRNPTPALVAMLDAGKGERFQMYDDDGELYYSGRIVRIGSASHDEGFEPLDDFGAPSAGCTEIRYLNAGKWETL